MFLAVSAFWRMRFVFGLFRFCSPCQRDGGHNTLYRWGEITRMFPLESQATIFFTPPMGLVNAAGLAILSGVLILEAEKGGDKYRFSGGQWFWLESGFLV
jgi:hypothetical protein